MVMTLEKRPLFMFVIKMMITVFDKQFNPYTII